MANQQHLMQFLKEETTSATESEGVAAWNAWRQKYPEIRPDLSGVDLSGVNLSGTDDIDKTSQIAYADETREFLSRLYSKSINLSETDLSGADLQGTNLRGANLSGADLTSANLSRANLYHANLAAANLTSANLEKADLGRANLIEANLEGTNLTGCFVYGVSAWDITLRNTIQSDLIVTRPSQPIITVDNLEVAQFVYLLLNNTKIREVIDTITSKVVLILGRFTHERKAVLNSLRDELRKQNYTPVVFDFEKPASKDLTETVSILAHLARFIIVDLTDPSSAPHEVATIIPHTVVPIQPLLSQEPLMVDGKAVERREYAMFEDLRRRYHWVLPTFRYQNTAGLLASLQTHIIVPAELKARELTPPK